MYAEVILANPVKGIDKPFHYAIPKDLQLEVGSQVLVSFGRRKDIGYVIGFVEKPEVKKVKPILELLNPARFFDEDSVALARFVADRYLSFFIRALRLTMPPGTKSREKVKRRKKKDQRPETGDQRPEEIKIGKHFKPTIYQQEALDLIFSALKNKKAQTILLHGVTGSGKTEVYLQAVAEVLKQGEGAIILVPEIILTPQLVERFTERFSDSMVLLHSGETMKNRQIAWEKVVSGEARVVLGTRTALFAPVKNLGLIVMDEEYENTYKADQSPRYSAKTVAEFISRQKNIPLVLGSATPSLESFYQAQNGDYAAVELPKRIDDRPLPPVKVVDMREEIKTRNFSVLSRFLRSAIQGALSRKEQIILFMNRLGYFTFVMCRDCGKIVECPRCSVSLSYYKNQEKLVCNRCGFQAKAPLVCPNCQSANIKFFGSGTSRIEKEVSDIFPKARILRVDSQTVKRSGAHNAIYGAFKEGKADVLIGTQLVTKGLDVANVTLVGVVAADTSLNLPDFRAAERTFQQLTQVAGRAGRHRLPGKVIIQTYMPEHYAIIAAAKHDYFSFYQEEEKNRKEADFPPFCQLVRIVLSSEIEKEAEEAAKSLSQNLCEVMKKEQVLGPAKAPIARLRGRFRYHILVKSQNIDEANQSIKKAFQNTSLKDTVNVIFDVDPQNMM